MSNSLHLVLNIDQNDCNIISNSNKFVSILINHYHSYFFSFYSFYNKLKSTVN